MKTKGQLRAAFPAVLPFLFAACAGIHSAVSPGKSPVVYPPPPDTARIQYLTSFSVSTDITGQRSGFMRMIAGSEAPFPVTKPYGVSIQKGKIYVCDSKISGLEIFDLEESSFEVFNPTGRGTLKRPVNCAVDTEGMLYVADTERKDVVIFDKNGEYASSIMDRPDMKPVDVCVYRDKILLLDLKNQQVRVYTKKTHAFLYSIPDSNAAKEAMLFSPTNMCVSNDSIYVSDMGDFNVKVYSIDGRHLSTIGSHGSGHGQFARPKGVAVDRSGRLYVVDAGFENVQMFNSDGSLLMFFGGPYKGPGDMWLPAKVIVDYENLRYFESLVYKGFRLRYLIIVTNQFGPDKISVYGYVEEKR